MTDIMERLRARNIRTIYVHIDSAEVRDEPPEDGSEDWIPFTIQRVNQEKLKRDGLWLVYAEHEIEKAGREHLKLAQNAEAEMAAREGESRRKPMPTPHLEQNVVQTYLVDRGNLLVLLMEGMVTPAYIDVREIIKPYEQALAKAIVNFSGVQPDPKAPRPSSSS